MKCPSCSDAVLLMSDRQGVEIDYCPQCRGVWLDRGELDKLIARSADAGSPPVHEHRDERSKPQFVDSDHGHGRNPHGKRHKSWLSNIFD